MNILAMGMPTPALTQSAPNFEPVIAVISLILAIAAIRKMMRISDSYLTKEECVVIFGVAMFLINATISIMAFCSLTVTGISKDSNMISISAVEQHYNVKMLDGDPVCDESLPNTMDDNSTDVVFLDAKNVMHEGLLVTDNKNTILWLKKDDSIKKLVEYKSSYPPIAQPKKAVDLVDKITESTKWYLLAYAVWVFGDILILSLSTKKKSARSDLTISVAIIAAISAAALALIGIYHYNPLNEVVYTDMKSGITHNRVVDKIEKSYDIKMLRDGIDSTCENCSTSNKGLMKNFDTVNLDDLDDSNPTAISPVVFDVNGKPESGILRTIDYKTTLYIQQGNKLVEYPN